MSKFRQFELVEHFPFSSFFPKTLSPSFTIEDELDFTLEPTPISSSILDFTSTRRIETRVDRVGLATELYLQTLSDRVSALELSFDRLVKEKEKKKPNIGERKYTWTAEIKSPEEKGGFDRKYKWIAEVKEGKKKGILDKSYKYTAEFKGKEDNSPITRTCAFKVSNGDLDKEEKKEIVKKDSKKKNKDDDKSAGSTRFVEIQDESDHGALVLRQAFARRVEKIRGKRKELSPQDAAMKIQVAFRAYLIRRSQALRALRELAIAKSKLKEIRALFNNFSYRRSLFRDAEERQRFSEKIIVLLLTVDAIEGADMMVRSAKKSMVDELEAMLDVVDPQPTGKSLSMRRTFDMPDAAIQKELAAGVAQVVKLLDQDQNGSETFEACL